MFESAIKVGKIYKEGNIKQFDLGLWIELWVRSTRRKQKQKVEPVEEHQTKRRSTAT
jgi:hypothetical protein